MPQTHTIVASSTPTGESALALIRLTGPDCKDLCEKVFKLPSPTPRFANYGAYEDINGNILDRCVFTYFADKKSFTGEAMLEISTHGNPFIVQKIIEDLLERGCKPAEPGEFSRTAFLNGKIDLTQAEAIIDMIHARSETALNAARKQLDGSIGIKVNEIVELLLNATAHLEAYIDFPEDDLPEETQEGPIKELKELIEEMDELMATSHYSKLLHEGVKLVLAGLPNAGKSSLLNALMGEDRVIVSEIPGTTRDYVEERIMLGSYQLRIIDTAGLHEADSEIEGLGIKKTIEQVNTADFLLLILDGSSSEFELAQEVKEQLIPGRSLIVANKSDLENFTLPHFDQDIPVISLSAKTGKGLAELRAAILKELEKGLIIPKEDRVLISARHAGALKDAKASLLLALDKMKQQEFAELIANDLREAISCVEQITGRIDNELMLDKLFGEFCIGK